MHSRRIAELIREAAMTKADANLSDSSFGRVAALKDKAKTMAVPAVVAISFAKAQQRTLFVQPKVSPQAVKTLEAAFKKSAAAPA